MDVPPLAYHFKIHKEGSGFWAQCLELPECLAEGSSKEELKKNMKIALNEYFLESERILRYVPPSAAFIKTGRSVVEVEVDPSVVRKEQGRRVYVTAPIEGYGFPVSTSS